MNEAVIILDNVSKSYPLYHHITGGLKNFLFNMPQALRNMRHSRFEALKNTSFEIYKGESFGIIGKNGAGKSTILGLIAGVLKPSKGRVIVNGRISPLLELGAGFHHELTGRENIMLNGVLLGLTRAEVLAKMDEIIEFSELGEFIEQPIRTYSSGMLARLGFSVVSSLDPEILLIDEILAVGDMDFQKKCLERMMGFKKKGVTMVFVSHSMPDVQKICDRVVLIENHTLKNIGMPDSIIAEYTGEQYDRFNLKENKGDNEKETFTFEGKSIEEIFTYIYKNNYWKSNETRSGTGSTLEQTKTIVQNLPKIFKQFNIKSILDIPCGDFNWMRNVDMGSIKYIGADIIEELLDNNIKLYSRQNCTFKKLNIIRDDLPAVDMVFCRDCFGNLSNENSIKSIRNIRKSKSRYLLCTTYTQRTSNEDAIDGHWRPINMEKAPFYFPPPILLVNENCTECDGEFADKSLGLWEVGSL